MFKRKTKQLVEGTAVSARTTEKKPINWMKISVIANIAILVIAVVGLSSYGVIYQTNTNPEFCRLCHPMQSNVESYMSSNNLDNLHKQAGVQCKECHDYSVAAEIKSGVNYVIGNYTVDKNGSLKKKKFDDEMCLQCHISNEYVAQQTDFLARNPHDSPMGEYACYTCHVSHGEQIDYCSGCHDNGGQRMVGGEILPRENSRDKESMIQENTPNTEMDTTSSK